MSTKDFICDAAKNPAVMIFVALLTIVMAVVIVGDIQNMRTSTSGYDYSQNLCYLFENICICYFMAIFEIMYYLTYINKQYSKWSIWLFYISAVAMLAHFVAAGYVFDYVFAHVGADHMDSIPSLARNIFSAPGFFIILCFFFVPKLIKDTLKLKQEQELTI